MIPANGAPHDLEARDVHRSLSFAQRRARDNSHQIGARPNCRSSSNANFPQYLSTRIDPEELPVESPSHLPGLLNLGIACHG
jgi:hypothetical protein